MDQGFILQIELYSEKSQSLEVKALSFPSCPATIQEIKDKIEESFCIPISVQTVLIQNNEVPINCSPASLYLRSGDTVRVLYPAKGLTDEVKSVTEWLKEVTDVLDSIQKLDQDGTVSALTVEHFSVLTDSRADCLLRKLFTPWINPATQVNGVHFTSVGGVELLTKLHRHIIEIRKHKFHYDLRNMIGYMEYICCETCVSFSMNQACASYLAQCGGLENCIDSFLMRPANDDNLRDNNLYSVIEIALCAILNISEIPDVQLNLSHRTDVIEQAFIAGRSVMYSTNTPVMAISLLLCISRCQEAHGNLLTSSVVDEILDLCTKPGIISSPAEIKSLKCYAGVTLAQMISGSVNLLQTFPLSSLERIKKLMHQVCTFHPAQIRAYETSQKLYWETFSACVQYLYVPNLEISSEANSTVNKELSLLSVEVLLLYLQNALGRKIHVDIIINEGLLDFVVALPWVVPECYEERAKCVVREIAKFQSIHPPPLTVIAKAKLAKSTWGLKKLIEIHSVSQLLCL